MTNFQIQATYQDGVAEHFGIRGFPFWVIVDHHGKIITRLSGSYTEEQFQIILANTLKHDKNAYADHH